MSRHYKVNKGAAFVFNLIIAAVCACSVIAYFLFPLWNVKLGYTLNEEQVKQLLDSDDEAANEIVAELSKEGVTVTFAVRLETDTFLSSFVKEGGELINDIIDSNIESLVNELSLSTKSIVRAAVRVAAKTAVKEALGEGVQLKDEQNAEEQLNAVADALTADNATVTSVTDTAMTAMENIYSVETDGAPLSEADKENCRKEIENALKNVADEEGNIDLDSFTADLLVKALKESLGESEKAPAGEETASAPQTRVVPVSFFATAESEGESGTSSTDELKTLIKEKVNETLSPEVMQKIQLAMKIVAGVILFTFFTWAWVVIKMPFKIAADNPTVKLKLPVILGWLPFIALYILPKAAVAFLKKEGGAQFAGMTLAVSTCSVVSAIAALALIVISVPYHALKKRV
ncbi:MAG: hypothetical protein SPH68_06345 [Candidatus Borkfalkiaceae bacterium]|nr:hypothetical protein [Clostridia bacterium]MDY6223757.1 hypothetical protein [Christensenellaceae bacterium]